MSGVNVHRSSRSHPKSHSNHFHLPGQLLLGLFFFIIGGAILASKMNLIVMPIVPINVLNTITAIGSFVGGFYLVVTKLHKPRIYL